MYEYYYEKFQPFWKDNLKLSYMDTDSFVMSIKTQDLEKDLEYFKNDFDFSEMHPENQII